MLKKEKEQGMNNKINAPTICENFGGNGFRAKYHAIMSGMANFINSLGCILPIPGKLIQRFAPILFSPMTRTNNSKNIPMAYKYGLIDW